MITLQECHCHYHDESGPFKVKHIVACCSTCTFCSKKIKLGFYDSHKEECESEWKKLIEKIGDSSLE